MPVRPSHKISWPELKPTATHSPDGDTVIHRTLPLVWFNENFHSFTYENVRASITLTVDSAVPAKINADGDANVFTMLIGVNRCESSCPMSPPTNGSLLKDNVRIMF